jgi:putative ABC transport system permease protein
MNIMLVSVRERTREIGIRKAVGARSRDILAQFLIEALTLSVLGGLIGIVLGLAVSAGIARLAGWSFVLSPTVVAVALLFSLAVGVIFGVWPARQAARLDPISALRWE